MCMDWLSRDREFAARITGLRDVRSPSSAQRGFSAARANRRPHARLRVLNPHLRAERNPLRVTGGMWCGGRSVHPQATLVLIQFAA
jgi:hypothetical protein